MLQFYVKRIQAGLPISIGGVYKQRIQAGLPISIGGVYKLDSEWLMRVRSAVHIQGYKSHVNWKFTHKRCSHDAPLIESTKKRGNEELNPAIVESTAAGLHPQALMQKTAAPPEPGGRAAAGETNLEPMKQSTSVMDRL
jgi:hypothetical protein